MKKNSTNCSECKKTQVSENKSSMYKKHIMNSVRVPAGCRECGGPYPLCRDSCPMFDD